MIDDLIGALVQFRGVGADVDGLIGVSGEREGNRRAGERSDCDEQAPVQARPAPGGARAT